jgi:hypothetical protein
VLVSSLQLHKTKILPCTNFLNPEKEGTNVSFKQNPFDKNTENPHKGIYISQNPSLKSSNP